MTAPTPEAVAQTLTPGQRRAVLAMSAEWQQPGRCRRFSASDAWNVEANGWAEMKTQAGYISLYRLTPLGLAVQARLREIIDAG